MRLTKIYTKVGDEGKTLLASGDKVYKHDPRIECYGTVDELNTHLGFLRDLLAEKTGETFSEMSSQILKIQNELFDLGGELATPAKILDINVQQVVRETDITRLENEIDLMNEQLKPLENFVLPGGNICHSQAHVCRTVCRRAERRWVAFSSEETVRRETGVYLNRLSDWLFVASRFISLKTGSDEVQWQQKGKNS